MPRDTSKTTLTTDNARTTTPAGGDQWVGIVANAASGLGQGRSRVDRLAGLLERSGFTTRIAWTPEERQLLVEHADADPNARCLVAVGGDGTIASLLNEQPRTPITVLPAGTENLFARHFGMRPDPDHTASTIADGRLWKMDLGNAPDRRFALMAGIGFDADVVTRHHLARIGAGGRMRTTHRGAYVEPVLRSSLRYRFPALRVQAEGPDSAETFEGAMAFVFNLPCYALGLPIAPTARGDDGLLDLVVFRDPGPFHALRYLWLVFRGAHLRAPGVLHRKVRSATITANEPVPVQLDGDPGGAIAPADAENPWTAAIIPGAVGILVPREYRVALAS